MALNWLKDTGVPLEQRRFTRSYTRSGHGMRCPDRRRSGMRAV
jgi:hypothetical protein